LIDLLDDLSNNLKESLNTLNINNIKSWSSKKKSYQES
jgi:hypothetical protein